jgi:predicted Zn-dependent protease
MDGVSNKKIKSRQYDLLYKAEKWQEAEKLLLGWLQDNPDDHWLLVQLSEVHYLQHQHEKAVEYGEKAFDSEPRCPLAVWQYAEALHAVSRDDEASSLYEQLLRRGINRIAYGMCGEGLPKARSLINDTQFAVADICAEKGDYKRAKRYLIQHIADRGRNCRSVFSLSDARKLMACLNTSNQKPKAPVP